MLLPSAVDDMYIAYEILILFGIMCGDDATFDWLCARKINGHGKRLVLIGTYKTLLTIRYNTNPKWCAISSINGIMVDKWFWKPLGLFYHENFPRSSKKMFCPPQRFFEQNRFGTTNNHKKNGILAVFCCASVRIDDICWIYPFPVTSPPRLLRFCTVLPINLLLPLLVGGG